MSNPLPIIRTLPAMRVRVTVFLAVAAAIAYVCRTSLAVAEKTIREELDLSEATMGFLLGPAFFWPYAMAQIPGGWLGDRIGARRNLPLVAVAWSIASAAFGLAWGATLLIVARITGGLAQAGLMPCSAATVARWHPPGERALASGVLGAAMSIGAAGGAALTGELLESMNWRMIFVLYALPGIAWSLVFYVWFRNTPEEHPRVSKQELKQIRSGDEAAGLDPALESVAVGESKQQDLPSESTYMGAWEELLSRPSLWLICGQQFFRAAGYAFFASWFATYMQETRNVSTAESGWLLTVPLLATVAGSLFGGAISDAIMRHTNNLWMSRSLLASLALSVCACLVLGAWFVPNAGAATMLIGTGAFCAALAGPCAYATSMDLGGKHVTQVFSTMNMVGNFGAGLIPWLVPWFRQWIDATPSLLALAGNNSWNAVLLLFGMMYVWAAACWIGLKPRSAPRTATSGASK